MSDITNKTTSYRYEIKLHPDSWYSNRNRLDIYVQKERLLDDDILRRTLDTSMKQYMAWEDSTELLMLHKMGQRSHKLMDKEYKLERDINIIVRRAALRNQIDLEDKQYDRELRTQGKAIFTQRI